MKLLMKFGKFLTEHAGAQIGKGSGQRGKGGNIPHAHDTRGQARRGAGDKSYVAVQRPDMNTGQNRAETIIQLEILLRILPYLGITHHLPGRLRLRADSRIEQEINHGEISGLSIPGVEKLTVNTLTGSILVTYDPDALPFSHIQNLFTIQDRGEQRRVAALLWPGLNGETNKDKPSVTE